MATVPFRYQLQGARGIARFEGRCLLADDMGLGKSLQSLLYANRHPELRPIVIVCPASLKFNWERECKKHFNMRADILWGTKPPKEGLISSKQILIINYEILSYWLDYIKRLEPKLVIADEVHFCKNRRAKRTKAVKSLAKVIPHVIALSGTPLTNRPGELWSILNILRPDLFKNFHEFGVRYAGARFTPWGWQYNGASRLDELHKLLLSTCMVRRTKEEVFKELPRKRRFTVPLPLSDPEQYRQASDNFLEWIYKFQPGKMAAAQRAERLSQMSYLRQLAGQLKLPAIFDWVDNFLAESEEKIILFAWHVDLIDKIHDRYKKNSVKVYGRVKGVKRDKAFNQFLNDKKTRILVGNMQTIGTGLSAKGVSTAAFVEYSFVPIDLTQSEARIHGLGRGVEGERSTIYYLCAHSTIEEPLLEILQKKQKVISHVLDGKGRGEKLDVYDLLHNALLKQKREL